MQQMPLATLAAVFGKIGLISFGGPAAQIALLQRETVDQRGWLDEDRFLRGLGFCMLLPGPEAMQLATYIGWHLRGVVGGLIAGGLFVLPGALVIAALSAIYITYGAQPLVDQAFIGIKAAVLAIVVAALWRLGRRALSGARAWFLAAGAFLALFVFAVPFPAIIIAAGLIGLMGPEAAASSPPADHAPPIPQPGRLARVVALWGAAWLAPLGALWMAGGGVLFDLARFFGQLAILSFGGAYAVLAYMTQTLVQTEGWITADQMIDALGLAETTPGPLILVTQFVGHLSGHDAGGWGLWLAAGAITLWMTFVPCFLWIFAGAPYLDAITARPRLNGALRAITAAIVGVMANLALWFALNTIFGQTNLLATGPIRLSLPVPSSLSPIALAVFGFAALLLWWRNWPVPLALLASMVLALGLSVLPG